MSGYRLPSGGEVDRTRPLGFTFDGRSYQGFAGDTLASALLASGEQLFGRSFKYHRPRGVVGLGVEEPNALITLRDGARAEPNIQATMAELFDGLTAKSQNAWPSLRRDVMAVNALLSPFLGAGFYYKTFMGPFKRSWMWYEPFIRRAAGLGSAPEAPDPDVYDKGNLFCDVLVVGGGPAGLLAAKTAASAGLRVVLADDQAALGGALRGNGSEAGDWARETVDTLREAGVRLMPRTSVFGYYDGQVLGAVERLADHIAVPGAGQPRQKYWVIRASQVVLATGAVERPLVFPGNDRPGVMLASALRGYAERYGVAAGRQVVVATNNDSGYGSAQAFAALGGKVAAIVDLRDDPGKACREIATAINADLHTSQGIASVHGRHGVTGVSLVGKGRPRIACDCLAMSGGWTPLVHLASQRGTPPVYDPGLASFVPGDPASGASWIAAGAINGKLTTSACLGEGEAAGATAAKALGKTVGKATLPDIADELAGTNPLIQFGDTGRGKAFVDFQNDVTAGDVKKAHAEGYRSVEHLKRYTTLGMATDQGRTSNVNAIAIMADLGGTSMGDTGTTRFRPPYTPVTLGALAGRHTGGHFAPTRRTPMQDWHAAHRGLMAPVGAWMRPRAYLKEGETLGDAYVREARNVREAVGICDVSTLGKIDVQGPDAAEFLNRVYSNPFLKVPVGKARYGLMLRDDGMILDDGTSWRLSETQFLMTTTTGGAGTVMSHLERLLAIFWPELRVAVTSTTSQWAGMSLAGPRARDVLAAALPGVDVSDDALPFMGLLQTTMNGAPVLIARLSFSGELAFEVFTGADHGLAVWEHLLERGTPFGIAPYGTEALGALRIEKGHIAGGEMDGRISPFNVGLGGMLSAKKDYFGSKLVAREGLHDETRYEWVGLISTDKTPLKAGAHVVDGTAADPGPSQGWVSSVTYSPALDAEIGLALVKGGSRRIGEQAYAANLIDGQHPRVKITSAHFFDPEGSRMKG